MNYNNIYIGLFVVIFGLLGYLIYRSLTVAPVPAFIDMGLAFEGFDMTKELKGKHEAEIRKYEQRLDSLGFRITALVQSDSITNALQIFELKRSYARVSGEREELLSYGVSEADEKIQRRLLDYLTKFSQSQGHSYLIVFNNSFPVAYVNPAFDFTDEFIEFSNRSYSGQ